MLFRFRSRGTLYIVQTHKRFRRIDHSLFRNTCSLTQRIKRNKAEWMCATIHTRFVYTLLFVSFQWRIVVHCCGECNWNYQRISQFVGEIVNRKIFRRGKRVPWIVIRLFAQFLRVFEFWVSAGKFWTWGLVGRFDQCWRRFHAFNLSEIRIITAFQSVSRFVIRLFLWLHLYLNFEFWLRSWRV